VSPTVHITPSVEPLARHSKLLRSVGHVWASLRALIDRAYREGSAVVGPMTRAQEANATREFGVRFFRTDPRFAADLCAAADRHERGENT
jgi:hypothetical protein